MDTFNIVGQNILFMNQQFFKKENKKANFFINKHNTSGKSKAKRAKYSSHSCGSKYTFLFERSPEKGFVIINLA